MPPNKIWTYKKYAHWRSPRERVVVNNVGLGKAVWSYSILFPILSHNLGKSSGYHRWVCNNPFPSCPVFSRPSWAGKVHSCPLWYFIPFSASICLFFFVISLCPAGLSLLNQKTLKHGQTIFVSVSWLGSGVYRVLQWLLGSFCEPPHWSHGPCTKCSIASGSISSQRPVFFS